MSTPRELAVQSFAKGDRVQQRANGRTGTVQNVNVYAAAVVGVTFDDERMRVLPCLYFTLDNITRRNTV